MTRKKGKFLTFCCSLIPGAGEMYLGFLKTGRQHHDHLFPAVWPGGSPVPASYRILRGSLVLQFFSIPIT